METSLTMNQMTIKNKLKFPELSLKKEKVMNEIKAKLEVTMLNLIYTELEEKNIDIPGLSRKMCKF